MLVVVSGLPACNKYIDIPEKGKVIPTTIDDYYHLLSDFNTFSRSTVNVFYVNDEIKIYKDEVSRIFFAPEVFTNGYLWNDYLYVNNSDHDPDWNNFYEQIYKCNVVLEKIDAAAGTDEALRRQTKGEALAHRAYAYFMLVNLYGKHYDPDTYDTDLGVPLYLEPDINAALPRATVKEVYNRIEEDLQTAVDLLAPQVPFNYHPSQAGVKGLLAKLYLYQGKFEQARDYADEVLEENSFLYNFNDFDFLPGLPKWLGLPGFPIRGLDNNEVIWDKASSVPFVYMIGVYMSDEHHALYEEGDRRLYFALTEDGPFGPNMHGYALFSKDQYYKAGINTPEMILIRAECHARLSQPDLAIADLNTLRQKRFNPDTFTPLPFGQSRADALALVLRERRIELFQEATRWFDLKRLNRESEHRRTINRTFEGESHTLTPNDLNYVLAIPKNIISLNPLVEQNPRAGRP